VSKPIPFGKYYLLDRIAAGGMAEVFRAKAFGVEGFERIVAVKRILPSIAADTDFITMFIDEAKLAVQLNHANIAQIFDLGKVGDSYFIALEYVHGKDVRALFDRLFELDERALVELPCYVAMRICEGLDYAHHKRDASGRPLELVHRDVSPQNMLISFDGDVKLIDFGIAKAAGKEGRTRAGILKGKFGYLSPEQVLGAEVDLRSDIFGVGIVLHELLTGQRLFVGDSEFSTIEKVRSAEITPPHLINPDVTEGLSRIVMKALSRNPNKRYQTARELQDDLQRFLREQEEPFTRRELSAFMCDLFPEHAEDDQEAVGDLRGVDVPSADATDVTPIVEPAESKAVNDETREIPAEITSRHPATLLGMPVAKASAGGRSAPPPPPPRGGGGGGTRPPGRGTQPPRPGTQPPRPATQPPMSRASQPPPPPRNKTPSIPSVATPPPTPPSFRSLPPPPAASGSYRPGSIPPAVAGQNPVLDMDWDDEELSTQVYDRPEDQYDAYDTDYGGESYPGAGGGYEDYSASYQQPSYQQPSYQQPAPFPGQSAVPTFVPPPAEMPGYEGYASEYGALPDAPVPVAPVRAHTATQQMLTQSLPEKSRSPFYAMAVTALILVCFLAYMFLSKTEPGVVQLTTHPADATVVFDGKSVGTSSPYLVTGVAPGDKHLLEVKKDGYRSWSQEVQVQPGQTLQFPVTLQPSDGEEPTPPMEAPRTATGAIATGSFTLESSPPGAKVFLDGQELGGVTPLRVGNLVAKGYTLKLLLPDYREQTLHVDVKPEVDQTLPRVVLQPERVHVRIVSDPSGAEVSVVRGSERKSLGRSPVDVTLDNDGSAWTVEVSKGGFAPFAQSVAMSDGQRDITIKANLVSGGGESEGVVSAPPHRSAPVAAPPRPAPRPAPVRERAAPAPEPRETARAEPEPSAPSGGGTGTLRINSRPWSQVVIDGKPIGSTPQMNVTLSEGTHKVTLTNPEFDIKKTLTVKIKAGQVETQIVALQ
jgi:serine/threonine protein kinase